MEIQLDLFETTEEETLTPRQWALWRLIEHNSLIEHRKTSQREIFENVEGYEWNEKETCHDHCPAIWADINANNESDYHDKIIISKDFEYWIGSQRETEAFLRRLWRQVSPRLKRFWKYTKKTKLDGTGKLLSNQGSPIEEHNNNIKLFHEAFNNFDIEMQKAMESEDKENEDI